MDTENEKRLYGFISALCIVEILIEGHDDKNEALKDIQGLIEYNKNSVGVDIYETIKSLSAWQVLNFLKEIQNGTRNNQPWGVLKKSGTTDTFEHDFE